MATGNAGIVRARRLMWGLALLIFLGIPIAFIVPLAALPLSMALIAGGIVAYRQTKDPIVRAVAVAAIVAGTFVILTLAGIMFFLAPVRGSIFSSVSEPTPIVLP